MADVKCPQCGEPVTNRIGEAAWRHGVMPLFLCVQCDCQFAVTQDGDGFIFTDITKENRVWIAELFGC